MRRSDIPIARPLGYRQLDTPAIDRRVEDQYVLWPKTQEVKKIRNLDVPLIRKNEYYNVGPQPTRYRDFEYLSKSVEERRGQQVYISSETFKSKRFKFTDPNSQEIKSLSLQDLLMSIPKSLDVMGRTLVSLNTDQDRDIAHFLFNRLMLSVRDGEPLLVTPIPRAGGDGWDIRLDDSLLRIAQRIDEQFIQNELLSIQAGTSVLNPDFGFRALTNIANARLVGALIQVLNRSDQISADRMTLTAIRNNVDLRIVRVPPSGKLRITI